MDREIEQLRAEIRELRRRITQKPDIILPNHVALHVVIVGGNELETGQDGVAYEADGVASVPSAYDPDVNDTFIDGIGRGTLFVNNISQDGYVLVVNDNRGSFGNSLRNGDRVAVSDPVLIPVDGGGNVVVYVIA